MVKVMFREKQDIHASRNKPLLRPPIQFTSLVEIAYDLLLDAIFDSRLSPGKTYSQSVIAREMDMSTTPVHEALTLLASKGFIKILPRRGVRLTELGRAPFNGIFEFRRILERKVIFKVVPQLTDAHLEHLHAMIIDWDRQMDVPDYLKADDAIHSYLASLTRNHYLINTLAGMGDQWNWIGQRVLQVDGCLEAWRQHHRKIYACLEDRDPQGAWQVMKQHLDHTERLFTTVSKHKSWFFERQPPELTYE